MNKSRTIVSTTDRRYGDEVLNRFQELSVSRGLAAVLASFVRDHRAEKLAADAAEEALARFDAATASVITAEQPVLAAIRELADAIVGAHLADRRSPFRSFSKVSAGRIAKQRRLALATSANDVATAILASRPPAVVARVARACAQVARDLVTAIDRAAKPKLAWATARAEREALGAGWNRSLARLKLHARVAFEDRPGLHGAVFARSAPKKRSSPGATPAPAPSPAPVPAAVAAE